MQLLLPFLFALVTLDSPSPAPQEIIWHSDRPLEWTDFVGRVPAGHRHDALCTSGMRYQYSVTSRNGVADIDLSVEAFFKPHESWVKKGKKTVDLLAHERLHFDISEWHARKLHQALKAIPYSDSYKRDMSKTFSQIEKERTEMQALYDKESHHSMNESGQKKWETRVQKELQKFALN